MRRGILVLLVCCMSVALLFSAGCAASTSSISSDDTKATLFVPGDKEQRPTVTRDSNHVDITVQTTVSTEGDASIFVEGGYIDLKKVVAVPMLDSNISQSPELIFGSDLLLSRRVDGYTEYYLYDMATGKFPQYIVKTKTLAHGSGSVAFTEGRYLWFAHDTRDNLNKMHTYRLDLKEKNCKIIETRENFPPFKYFYKVNDSLLITHRPEELDDGKAYAYHIETLDTKTLEVKNLATANTAEGTHVPCICYADEKIYAVLNLTDRQETYIRIYNISGKVLRDIRLPKIYGARIDSLLVKGNHAFLRCIDDGVRVFRLSAGAEATEVEFSTKGFNTSLRFVQKNLCVGEQQAVLYDESDSSLITYQAATDTFHRYVLNVDAVFDEQTESIYPYISEDGMLYFITASNSAVENTISENEIFTPIWP